MSMAGAVDAEATAARLLDRGHVHLASVEDPRAAARAVFAASPAADPIGEGMPELQIVGEFTAPPAGVARRDYQVLHIDFGLPVRARGPVDVARFTALSVGASHPPPEARTRIVALRRLLGQRRWAGRGVLRERLRGASFGTDGPGEVEGILARLVEAADGSSSLIADPDLLCGMEFDAIGEERAHLARHGLDLAVVEERVLIEPGDLLLLDNLATAHGRVGRRAPEELDQLCVGYPRLGARDRGILLDRVLRAFG